MPAQKTWRIVRADGSHVANYYSHDTAVVANRVWKGRIQRFKNLGDDQWGWVDA